MTTYFAPAERANDEELKVEIEIVSQNSIVQGLLYSVSGVLAVLDEHRQVVALNDSFLKMLGIDDPRETLGLRPGEVLGCIHCNEEPGGCGTSKFCSTCGAAIAVVASLGNEGCTEKICALTTNKTGAAVDMALLVRSHPIDISGKRFLLLFLQDITIQEQRAALERTFFHDINNILTGLIGSSEMLVRKHPELKLAEMVHKSSLRLYQEVAVQKCLFNGDLHDYKIVRKKTTPQQILQELQNIFTNHPAAINKKFNFPESCPDLSLNTDLSLVIRVLGNMLTNAFEATEENDEVRLWFEKETNEITTCVWNRQPIPENVALRIFQRNYTTKNQAGRGVGTYSMKLFGEKILGGKVSFSTSEKEGTIFRFSLPLNP